MGQTQLLQPFLTIIASVLLLGEHADFMTWLVAALVVAVVAVGKHAQVKHNDPGSAAMANTSLND